MGKKIVVLGVFVADTAYRATRQPRMGETILGNDFALGPGGKGSNQAVAAAMLSGDVHFISRLGNDSFAELALSIWNKSGVIPEVSYDSNSYTGAAFIYIDEKSGDNAIIVCPGAANNISIDDVDQHSDLIASSSVFVTQMEQPMEPAYKALRIAKSGGSKTILNPAPVAPLDSEIFSFCDFITPNETETEGITGISVGSTREAEEASKELLRKGCSATVITLGENGAYFHDGFKGRHVNAFNAGKVVETTGAGDAFNGGFAVAIANGMEMGEAVEFGCAVAAISVTRPGTASSMPKLEEVGKLIRK